MSYFADRSMTSFSCHLKLALSIATICQFPIPNTILNKKMVSGGKLLSGEKFLVEN